MMPCLLPPVPSCLSTLQEPGPALHGWLAGPLSLIYVTLSTVVDKRERDGEKGDRRKEVKRHPPPFSRLPWLTFTSCHYFAVTLLQNSNWAIEWTGRAENTHTHADTCSYLICTTNGGFCTATTYLVVAMGVWRYPHTVSNTMQISHRCLKRWGCTHTAHYILIICEL